MEVMTFPPTQGEVYRDESAAQRARDFEKSFARAATWIQPLEKLCGGHQGLPVEEIDALKDACFSICNYLGTKGESQCSRAELILFKDHFDRVGRTLCSGFDDIHCNHLLRLLEDVLVLSDDDATCYYDPFLDALFLIAYTHPATPVQKTHAKRLIEVMIKKVNPRAYSDDSLQTLVESLRLMNSTGEDSDFEILSWLEVLLNALDDTTVDQTLLMKGYAHLEVRVASQYSKQSRKHPRIARFSQTDPYLEIVAETYFRHGLCVLANQEPWWFGELLKNHPIVTAGNKILAAPAVLFPSVLDDDIRGLFRRLAIAKRMKGCVFSARPGSIQVSLLAQMFWESLGDKTRFYEALAISNSVRCFAPYVTSTLLDVIHDQFYVAECFTISDRTSESCTLQLVSNNDVCFELHPEDFEAWMDRQCTLTSFLNGRPHVLEGLLATFLTEVPSGECNRIKAEARHKIVCEVVRTIRAGRQHSKLARIAIDALSQWKHDRRELIAVLKVLFELDYNDLTDALKQSDDDEEGVRRLNRLRFESIFLLRDIAFFKGMSQDHLTGLIHAHFRTFCRLLSDQGPEESFGQETKYAILRCLQEAIPLVLQEDSNIELVASLLQCNMTYVPSPGLASFRISDQRMTLRQTVLRGLTNNPHALALTRHREMWDGIGSVDPSGQSPPRFLVPSRRLISQVILRCDVNQQRLLSMLGDVSCTELSIALSLNVQDATIPSVALFNSASDAERANKIFPDLEELFRLACFSRDDKQRHECLRRLGRLRSFLAASPTLQPFLRSLHQHCSSWAWSMVPELDALPHGFDAGEFLQRIQFYASLDPLIDSDRAFLRGLFVGFGAGYCGIARVRPLIPNTLIRGLIGNEPKTFFKEFPVWSAKETTVTLLEKSKAIKIFLALLSASLRVTSPLCKLASTTDVTKKLWLMLFPKW